ncbi:MAG TPA: hypothetical protein VGD76_01440, partial [Ramlibacter sp.]
MTTLFALSVACATGLALAQTPPATAPAGAPGANAQAPAAGKPATPASPKSLEAKIEMCVGCHGII